MSTIRCQHVLNWPDPKLIMAGVMQCPYCRVVALEHALKVLEQNLESTNQELSAALQRTVILNASNTALQRLAMDACSTPEQIGALLRINQEQYDESLTR